MIHETGLVGLGFTIKDRPYGDPVRVALRTKLKEDGVMDREGSIDFFVNDRGEEFALVGFAMDGHGCATIYKVL